MPETPASGPPGAGTPWGSAPAQPGSLLEPEYAPHLAEYQKTKSPQAAGRLLGALKPVLDESLRSYAGPEAGSATARAHAKRLALEAVSRYDPSRAKLRTHLLSHLRGLRRLTERATAPAYLPEQWRLDAQRVDRVAADARDELGREPSDAEVADRSGVPVGRVRRARSAPGVLAGGQLEGGFAVERPDERAWNDWVEGVYHDLGPLDQVILEHSFGLHGRDVLPANQVARLVGLSPGAVSMRKLKIQQSLDEFDAFMGRK